MDKKHYNHLLYKKIDNFKNFERNNKSRNSKYKEDFKKNYNPIAKDKSTLNNRVRSKINKFKFNKVKGKSVGYKPSKNYTKKDVEDKVIGDEPICYLTGRKIDLYNTKSWQFDHILPKSRGGTGGIENMGIACYEANQAKGNLTVHETLQLCKEILEHNGYKVTQDESSDSKDTA
jgi:hypothetical protein|tara:strand:- start:124 stop:648 length:525 start_codon:yes stop_codon:yes gene_type:complete